MDWLFQQNQIFNIKEDRLRIALLLSLAAHGFFLFMAIDVKPVTIVEPDLTVQLEIEKPVLIPKIEELAEVKKLVKVEEEIIKKVEVQEEIKEIEEVVSEVVEEVVVEDKKEVVQEVVQEENIIIEKPDVEAMLRYQDMIKRKIQELRKYPRWAKKQGFQGVSVMSFLLNPSGAAQDVRLVRSSGFSILDKEAVATVKRASPFPPIPSTINQELIIIEVGLNFQIEQ